MRAISSAAGPWNWLRGFRPHTVVLTSPHSPGECCRRLAAATTARGFTSWHIDPANAGRPEPRLRGDVSSSRIFVAGFENASGRNSFAAWLDVRPEPAAGGGTTLAGKIGLHPAAQAATAVIPRIWGLLALIALAAGGALLASGHLSGLLPALIPFAMTAVLVGFNAVGLRSLQRAMPKLIREVNGILGSTATFLDR